MKKPIPVVSEEEVEAQRKELANRLRERRLYLGFTQDEVAQALRVNRPALSYMEAGVRKVEAVELDVLARLYTTTPEELLHGQPKPPEHDFPEKMLEGLGSSDIAELKKFAQFLKSKSNAEE